MKLFVDKKGYLNKPEFSDAEKIVLPSDTKVIGAHSFETFQCLKEIVLPDGISTIGEKAFFQCANLEVINLPESLNVIEENAFEQCLSLQVIKLPKNVDYIKEMTFLNCHALKKVILSPKTTSISDFAFKNCYKLNDIEIPDTTERIGVFSFLHCLSLKEIKLPSNLVEINNYSFSSCTGLKKIHIPSKVKIIREGAFFNCFGLEEIKLPKSLEVIERNAFSDCKNIKEMTLFNCANLVQPGLEECLNNFEYAYVNRITGAFLLTKEKIVRKNFEIIDYESIKKYLGCKKEEAIILSNVFSLEILKTNKMKFLGPILGSVFFEHDHFNILNMIGKNNKEFARLYKKLSLDIYFVNNLLGQNNKEIYDLFKFAYNLGAFNDNQIERQKACEYISNLFDKGFLDIYNVHDILGKIKINGYNKEWAEFLMDKNNVSLLFSNSEKFEYISRTYNEFTNIKEFCRSNKGAQHYNRITISACDTYFKSIKFEGVSDLTQDIANMLSKFTRNQSLFDSAKAIREEYVELREQGKVDDHLLKEPLFEEIDKERKYIIQNTNESVSALSEVANDKFTYEFLSKYDVANFVLGKYCDCCSHLEASGYSVMRASIIHPDCQNLIIRDKNGEIIAKSTLYINREEGYGLFNNVEIAERISDEDKTLIYKKYIKAVNAFVGKYNHENPALPLKQINVGVHVNDLMVELEKYTQESKTLLKGLDFSLYGNLSSRHEGDWKQGQRILFEKDKKYTK